MAQTKATAGVLSGFSTDLKQKHDEILMLKKSIERFIFFVKKQKALP